MAWTPPCLARIHVFGTLEKLESPTKKRRVEASTEADDDWIQLEVECEVVADGRMCGNQFLVEFRVSQPVVVCPECGHRTRALDGALIQV